MANVLKPGVFDVLDGDGSARANIERVLDAWEATAKAPDFNGCLVGRAVNIHRQRELALYLASDAAAYVTGVEIPIDGGLMQV